MDRGLLSRRPSGIGQICILNIDRGLEKGHAKLLSCHLESLGILGVMGGSPLSFDRASGSLGGSDTTIQNFLENDRSAAGGGSNVE